ncbi:hypothetical protein [Cellulomonas sp. URHB0016]
MGARNVSGALAMYPQLGHRAMRLLVGMSLRALDGPTELHPARTYFAGRDDLAEILGYRLPAAPDTSEAAAKQRTSAYVQVRKALGELIAAGAIERTVDGRGGRRSEYVLNVSSLPVDGVPQGYRNGAPEGYRFGAP